jgi:hypothetical protein
MGDLHMIQDKNPKAAIAEDSPEDVLHVLSSIKKVE